MYNLNLYKERLAFFKNSKIFIRVIRLMYVFGFLLIILFVLRGVLYQMQCKSVTKNIANLDEQLKVYTGKFDYDSMLKDWKIYEVNAANAAAGIKQKTYWSSLWGDIAKNLPKNFYIEAVKYPSKGQIQLVLVSDDVGKEIFKQAAKFVEEMSKSKYLKKGDIKSNERRIFDYKGGKKEAEIFNIVFPLAAV